MQFGKVISFNNLGRYFITIKNNLVAIIFALIFIIGFIIGTFSYKEYTSFVSFFKEVIDSFLKLRSDESVFNIALNSFLRNFTYIVFAFFFGTSILGIALLPFISIVSGIYYGGIFAGLYSIYSLNGISYCMLFVLPCALLFFATYIKSANESVSFSIKIAKLTFSNSMPYSLYYDFKNYCNKYIFYTLMLIVIAFIDGFSSYYFGDILSL